jgi:hypothetical protein
MTGGRMRDTLAGLFDDRAARRYAYASIVRVIAWLGAVAMILGVAARRLGLPSPVHAVITRLSAWRARSAEARSAPARVEGDGSVAHREAAAEPPPATAAPPQTPERPMTSAEMLAKKRREKR